MYVASIVDDSEGPGGAFITEGKGAPGFEADGDLDKRSVFDETVAPFTVVNDSTYFEAEIFVLVVFVVPDVLGEIGSGDFSSARFGTGGSGIVIVFGHSGRFDFSVVLGARC